jgi:uncharacterized protein YndB with AHSA1/START domain
LTTETDSSAARYGERLDANTLRFVRLLPGPIERVWSFLVDGDKRARWLASGPLEPRVGGAVTLRFRNSELSPVAEPVPDRYAGDECGAGRSERVLAFESPTRLVITWQPDSEVTFELAPVGDRVRLTLTHRRLVAYATMLSVAGGWHAHLDILDAVLGGRAPAPFWSAHAKLEREYRARLGE